MYVCMSTHMYVYIHICMYVRLILNLLPRLRPFACLARYDVVRTQNNKKETKERGTSNLGGTEEMNARRCVYTYTYTHTYMCIYMQTYVYLSIDTHSTMFVPQRNVW